MQHHWLISHQSSKHCSILIQWFDEKSRTIYHGIVCSIFNSYSKLHMGCIEDAHNCTMYYSIECIYMSAKVDVDGVLC